MPAVPPPFSSTPLPSGLFFFADGRTLLLRGGHFVWTSGELRLEGEVGLGGPNQLEFHSDGLTTTCHFQLHDGHLWLSLLRSDDGNEFVTDDCHRRLMPGDASLLRSQFRPHGAWNESTGTWNEAARRTDSEAWRPLEFKRRGDMVVAPWSADLGPVGIFPAPGVSGLGSWRSDTGERLVMSAEPPTLAPGQHPDQSRLRWAPDREGISHSVSPPTHHFFNHMDTWIWATFVPIGRHLGVRHVGRGFGGMGHVQYFHRVAPSPPVAAGLSQLLRGPTPAR